MGFKIGDKNFTTDQGLNLLAGTAQMASSIEMLAFPGKTQDQVLMSTSTQRSDGMTRFAGACLGTLGAANFAASTGGDSNFNRRMNRINAGHLALLSGLGATKLAKNESGLPGVKKDRLTAMTAVSAVAAAVYAFRGFKKQDD